MLIKELWSEEDGRRLADFSQSVKSGDLAGALLAIERAPAAEDKRVRTLLERWAERAAGYQASGRVERVSDALRWVLVDELNFKGDAADGMTAEGSYLSRVVAQRRGLPILMSSVWMLVGRYAGFKVEGIGMPSHFVVRVPEDEGLIVDPFNAGRSLSVAECKQVVNDATEGRVGWEDRFLEAVTEEALLERVLRNLGSVFVKSGEIEALFVAVKYMSALKPEAAEPRFHLARLTEELGSLALAGPLFEEVMERFPGTKFARAAKARLAAGGPTGRLSN
jgi:regulator of sirC expression with transglutaminase-like and TPR domain